MFKESKPNSRDRLSSPLVRKRNVTCHGQYMSPQASRKTKLTGLSRMKKKGSVPDDLIPALGADTANASNSFSEDPRNMQIKEHVRMPCVCMCVYLMCTYMCVSCNVVLIPFDICRVQSCTFQFPLIIIHIHIYF